MIFEERNSFFIA